MKVESGFRPLHCAQRCVDAGFCVVGVRWHSFQEKRRDKVDTLVFFCALRRSIDDRECRTQVSHIVFRVDTGFGVVGMCWRRFVE